MIHGPFHWPLNYSKSSCTLRKTAPKHNLSMSLLDLGDGVLWFILSITLPPNMVGWVDTKELELRFIWPHHFLPNLLRIIQIFPVKLKTDVYMCHLEGGWEVLFLVTSQLPFWVDPPPFSFLILPFLNNYSSSRHLLTKLLAGLVARSSFVQVCGLVPDVLWQFFGFAHIGGEVGMENGSVDRFGVYA